VLLQQIKLKQHLVCRFRQLLPLVVSTAQLALNGAKYMAAGPINTPRQPTLFKPIFF
jgi:hypothetical protein